MKEQNVILIDSENFDYRSVAFYWYIKLTQLKSILMIQTKHRHNNSLENRCAGRYRGFESSPLRLCYILKY